MEWKYFHYMQTGLTKLSEGKPCQDSVCAEDLGNGGYIAVVADGVGGYEFSEIAADAAVKGVISWVKDRGSMLCDREAAYVVRNNLLPYLRDEIRNAAARTRRSVLEMDCNIAFAYVRPDRGKAVIGQLGDTAVCVINDKQYVYTSPKQVVNATESVMGPYDDSFQVISLSLRTDASTTILLTTDGLDGYVYRKSSNWLYKNGEELINPLIRGSRKSAEREVGRIVSYLVKQYPDVFDDDISLAVLTNASTTLQLLDEPTWRCVCGKENPSRREECAKCGAEFFRLYDNSEFRKYGGRECYLYYFNTKPNEQRRLQPKLFAYIDQKKAQNSKGADNDALRRHTAEKPNNAETSPHKNETGKPETEELGIDDATKLLEKRNSRNNGPREVEKGSEGPGAQRGDIRPRSEGRIGDQRRQGSDQIQPRQEENGSVPANGNATDSVAGKNVVRDKEGEPWVFNPENQRWIHAVTGEIHPSDTNAQWQTQCPTGPEPVKHRNFRFVFVGGIALLLLILLLVAIIVLNPVKPHEDRTETDQTTASAVNGDVDSEWLREQEGDHFYGTVVDGLPHGDGVLWIGDEIWTGTFDHGAMTGVFQIVVADSPQDFRAVFFKADGTKVELYGGVTLQYQQSPHKVIRSNLKLRQQSGYNSPEVAKCDMDDILYIIETKEVEDRIWVRVISQDGQIGWCDKSGLEPIDH